MRNDLKPRNGIAGLKYWKYDISSGLQVALVSLPLSIGIAIASGAPPVTGLTSAIIAGLIFPFLGGAYCTISGPAAGLAPALLSGMLLLGNGDLAAGYPLLLVAICLTGIVQIILSLFNAGRLVAMFLPITVVEAMLAAIGTIIIIKQVPALLGHIAPPEKSMLVSIAKLPQSLMHMDPTIFLIGGTSLFLIFYLNRTRYNWMKKIPPPLFVCCVGIVLGYLLQLEDKYLITMPPSLFEGGIRLPAFGDMFAKTHLWTSLLIVVITLTLIDGIESIATIKAVDKIDPFQRKSHENTTLRAMGVSNLLSSLIGGLTIIPGGIKSRANIDAGGRTLWANFYNAVFLLIFLLFAKDIISRIPLAAIGAVLVYVGWRLCEIKIYARTYAIGRDQLLIFIITVVSILATDLLAGLIIGAIAEILLILYLLSPTTRYVITGRLTLRQSVGIIAKNLMSMFHSPILNVKQSENMGLPHYRISVASLTCFNLMSLDLVLKKLPEKSGLTFVFTEASRIIDHSGMEYLHQLEEERIREGLPFTVEGIDNFYQFTGHPLSGRMQDVRFVREKAKLTERQKELSVMAQSYNFDFNPEIEAVINRSDFIYLRLGANRERNNTLRGDYNNYAVKIFDYSHSYTPDYYVEDHHTLAVFRRNDIKDGVLPHLVIAPGHYLEHYFVEYKEVDFREYEQFSALYKVYAEDPEKAKDFLSEDFIRSLVEKPEYYIEIRNNAILVFHPGQAIEHPKVIPMLLSFTEKIEDLLQKRSKPKTDSLIL